MAAFETASESNFQAEISPLRYQNSKGLEKPENTNIRMLLSVWFVS